MAQLRTTGEVFEYAHEFVSLDTCRAGGGREGGGEEGGEREGAEREGGEREGGEREGGREGGRVMRKGIERGVLRGRVV